ncbi:MAG: hypothetical protein HYR76_14355 [Ignavibacteria bacterium]|nr:hypothetical protein [Ignavibacteria bacterium]
MKQKNILRLITLSFLAINTGFSQAIEVNTLREAEHQWYQHRLGSKVSFL